MAAAKKDVTTLLGGIRAGNPAAREELFRLVYEELRAVASRLISKERRAITFQSTDLVNEASIRLLANTADVASRREFFGAAANAMRRVLVDRARERNAIKRGEGASPERPTNLNDQAISLENPELLVLLNDALEKLESLNPRLAQIFEVWYFAGRSTSDIAEQHGISERTVQADLKAARAWLHGIFCA